MTNKGEVFEYMAIRLEGHNIFYIADHLAKMFSFKGDYNIRGLANDTLVISGWTSQLQVAYVEQIELSHYKDIKMEVLGGNE